MTNDNIVDNIGGVNKNVGKTMYLLMVDGILVGSTRKADVNKHLEGNRPIVGIDNYDKNATTLLYGLILDPQRLPYELPSELRQSDVWVLQRHPHAALIGLIECDKNNDIEEAVSLIENAMSSSHTLSIEDFAVIVGREVRFVLQIGYKQFEINVRCLSL